jgi:hypothetical protein
MRRLSNHALLAPFALIVALLLINGWFGLRKSRANAPGQVDRLVQSRRHRQRGRSTKNYQIALITGLTGARSLAVQPQTWS